MSKFKFTIDFFSNNIESFTYFLNRFCHKESHFLEIGSLEGRSAVWMLENILVHSNSTITCIELKEDLYNTRNTLISNLSFFGSKAILLEHGSIYDLSKLVVENRLFDFIYIDGQHDKHMPLNDLVMCHNLLKVDGLLSVDDYSAQNSDIYGNFNIKKCFDYFIDIYREYYNVLTMPNDYQQWVEKIA